MSNHYPFPPYFWFEKFIHFLFILFLMDIAPTLNNWTSLFLLAVAQGFFLVTLLLFRLPKRKLANLWLIGMLATFSVILLNYVGYWSGYNVYFPHFANIWLPLSLAISPLFYLYLRGVTTTERFQYQQLLHFAPLAIFVLSHLPFYLLSGSEKSAIIAGEINPATLLIDWQPWFYLYVYHTPMLLAQLSLYTFLAWRIFLKIDSKAIALQEWTRFIVLFFSAYAILFWAYYAMVYLNSYALYLDYTISLAMTFFIYAVGWLGYYRPAIFHGNWLPKTFHKYHHSTLTPQAADSLHQKLLAAMETEQLYLNSELRLTTLAQHLQTTPHILSQVLNEKIKKSYAEFINTYRIAAAKQQLADPAERKTYIINIAYDAGFNNKTSFNQAFKKATGMSPTAYRKQVLLAKSAQ